MIYTMMRFHATYQATCKTAMFSYRLLASNSLALSPRTWRLRLATFLTSCTEDRAVAAREKKCTEAFPTASFGSGHGLRRKRAASWCRAETNPAASLSSSVCPQWPGFWGLRTCGGGRFSVRSHGIGFNSGYALLSTHSCTCVHKVVVFPVVMLSYEEDLLWVALVTIFSALPCLISAAQACVCVCV